MQIGQTNTVTLSEGIRPYECVVGEIVGGIGGPLFRKGVAANTPQVVTRLCNTIVAQSAGETVPWDPASADAGTKVAIGWAPYPITGTYTDPTVPDSYVGQGPMRLRLSRMNYPGAGTAAGDAAATAALSALGFYVQE